jgi:hypothetical protein
MATLVNHKTNDLSLRREYTKTDTIGDIVAEASNLLKKGEICDAGNPR